MMLSSIAFIILALKLEAWDPPTFDRMKYVQIVEQRLMISVEPNSICGSNLLKDLPMLSILQERFKEWESSGVKVVHVLSQPDDGWSGETGYVQVS